jgi:hypothetical protein
MVKGPVFIHPLVHHVLVLSWKKCARVNSLMVPLQLEVSCTTYS